MTPIKYKCDVMGCGHMTPIKYKCDGVWSYDSNQIWMWWGVVIWLQSNMNVMGCDHMTTIKYEYNGVWSDNSN